MTVNTLDEAFAAKSNERKDSHTAHKVAVGAFAMEAAMQEGAAFQKELQWIAEGAQGDPLVEAAVAALPASIAQSGAASRPQLFDKCAPRSVGLDTDTVEVTVKTLLLTL
eukprot:2121169-Pyramimonas_sp.AAC.1